MAVSEDALLGGRIRIRQPVKGLRAGLDALLLAQAVPIVAGADLSLLDAGAGSGVVGIAVAATVPGVHVTALDIDPELTALSLENAALNGIAGRFRAVTADLAGRLHDLAALGVGKESFDVVVANPPFRRQGEGRPSPEPRRERADVMPAGGLELWMRALAGLARPGGRLVLIHRADAVGEILPALAGRFGAIALQPVYPRAGTAATRVLVGGIKGSRAPLRLLPGLVLHAEDGSYLAEAAAILGGARRIGLWSGTGET